MTYVIIIFIIIQNTLQENRIVLTFIDCYSYIVSENLLEKKFVNEKGRRLPPF